MAIIDPEGLFNGDRLRRCSNAAQLHWPRLYAASNGYGRLELNYAKLLRAYTTFSPVPSEEELEGYLKEYSENYLLFIYEADGQLWGQWDTRPEFLPRYKTASDRKSPFPMKNLWEIWRETYRKSHRNIQDTETTAFPKSFGNLSESFQRRMLGVGVGVGVGVGKTLSGANGAPGKEISSQTSEPAASPEQAIDQRGVFRIELSRIAREIHGRHPKARRDIGAPAIEKMLEKICASGSCEQKLERLSGINLRHAGWCACPEWGKDGGKYAKGLQNWLAPSMDRFDAEPPMASQEEPPATTKYTRVQ